MKAAYLYGPRDLRITDIAQEPVGPGEVRIAVAFSAVCGSDLHLYAHGPKDYASSGNPVPTGHEYSGRVIEIGPNVLSFRPGDRVTSIPGGPCNRCLLCRTGRQSMCRNRVSGRTGAWADSLVVPAEIVYKLPDEVSDRVGSLSEPLACAIRAVDRSGLRSADTACIIGGGPLGLMIMMMAKASGARTVIVSEPSAYRRTLAERLGADLTVDPTNEELQEVVAAHTGGLGAEVVFEVVGSRTTVEQAIAAAAPCGTVIIAGLADQETIAQFSPIEIFLKELTIRGTKGITHGMDRAIRWLGKLDFEPLLTHTFPLERAAEAEELSIGGNCGKVLISVGS